MSPKLISAALTVVIVFAVLWGTIFIISLAFGRSRKRSALVAALLAICGCLYGFWRTFSG
jgi:hypothetical protein